MARKCNWEIWEESSIGSDHYPVVTKDIETGRVSAQRGGRWMLEKADWDKS